MTASKLSAVVATILFLVGFVVIAFTDGDKELATYCLYLGLAAFATAHWTS